MREKTLKTLEYDKILQMLSCKCVSSTAKEKCYATVPSSDISTVKSLLEETATAESIILRRGNSPVESFDDITEFVKLAELGSVLSMAQLLRIARFMHSARKTKQALTADDNAEPDCITALSDRLTATRSEEEEIFRCIIGDDEMCDTASAELAEIRRQLRRGSERIKEKLGSYLRNPELSKLLQDPIITVRGDRYVLPVRCENKSAVPGIVHDQSSSGATLFIEPIAVVEINNELRILAGREKEEIERILTQLSASVGNNASILHQNLKVLTELDYIFARAKLSCDMHAVTPQINDNGYIMIKQGRHPLIDRNKVVPTDVWLGRDFTILLITGPNTGGKTVTLKTVGLFQLMVQSGLNVPCNIGSELTVFDDIFADIGDEQSIEQSLSTFSSHMTNIADIMRNVTNKSLVLFDELGAGTDPNEGASLAMAILETLNTLKTRTVATTHYSELKAYSLTTEGIENASVEFDAATLKPTYKLAVGVPGMSNAFLISQKLGLDIKLINRARELMSGERVRFESVLEKAEMQRRQAENEKQLAQQARKEAEQIRHDTDRMQRELEAQRQQFIDKAKKEAQKIVDDADKTAQQYIDELKALKENCSDEALIKMQTKRKAMKNGFNTSDEQPSDKPVIGQTLKPNQIVPGLTVFVASLAQQAIVQDVPNNKGEVKVQAGILQMNVKIGDLSLPPQQPKQNKGKTSINKAESLVPLSCDVRGETVDDAMLIIDRYLDQAAYAGYNEVTIIHGKGTGALRAGITQNLKGHSRVRSFRPGRYGEGEFGVTVVEIKK